VPNSSLNRLLFLAVPYNTRYITPNNQESRGIYCNWTRPCGSYIHIIPNTNLPNINLSTTLLHILVGPSSGSLPTHFPVQILHASRITPCKLYSHPIEAQLKQNKIPLGVSGTVIRHGSGFMHLWGFWQFSHFLPSVFVLVAGSDLGKAPFIFLKKCHNFPTSLVHSDITVTHPC